MKELDALINCPVCGNKYQEKNARVVQAKRSAVLVHASCEHCLSSFLAVVSNKPEVEGMVTMGMLTDLNYNEAYYFLRAHPVTADEVLDLYEENKK
ncbi:MAG: hypothetical protein R6V40_02290 [Candidatus Moraniibacteriota bacterium]